MAKIVQVKRNGDNIFPRTTTDFAGVGNVEGLEIGNALSGITTK